MKKTAKVQWISGSFLHLKNKPTTKKAWAHGMSRSASYVAKGVGGLGIRSYTRLASCVRRVAIFLRVATMGETAGTRRTADAAAFPFSR